MTLAGVNIDRLALVKIAVNDINLSPARFSLRFAKPDTFSAAAAGLVRFRFHF